VVPLPADDPGVAPDGSPVEVFRRLGAGPAPAYVHAAVESGASILDLGCGAGRLARALVALGHRVVGVDESPEMLATAGDLETVAADIGVVDLGRRFGGVVLASYLVNHPTRAGLFLATAVRHLATGGAVIVQRYDPSWARTPMGDTVVEGDVAISVAPPAVAGDRLALDVTYVVDGHRWVQHVDALVLDDADLDLLAAGAGLRVEGWLDEFRTWVKLGRR
jgi:SAM-dependent methyltransferase